MPDIDETNPASSTRIQDLENALAAKERELGMVREENNLRRLREMRMATTMQEGSHGQRAGAPAAPDPLDKELEKLDPEARNIVERLVDRKVAMAIAPIVEEVGGVKNITLAQANYQSITRYFPQIEQVAGEVAQQIDALPLGERETILRSPYAIALIGRTIYQEKQGKGNAPSGKPGDARGAIRSRAVGESATTGLTHDIGAVGDEPAIRKQIEATSPFSPEWQKIKQKMREERRARGIR